MDRRRFLLNAHCRTLSLHFIVFEASHLLIEKVAHAHTWRLIEKATLKFTKIFFFCRYNVTAHEHVCATDADGTTKSLVLYFNISLIE